VNTRAFLKGKQHLHYVSCFDHLAPYITATILLYDIQHMDGSTDKVIANSTDKRVGDRPA